MENYIYNITIPFTYDLDRPLFTSEESKKFLDNNPGKRVNSIGILDVANEDETEITLTITIEYEG